MSKSKSLKSCSVCGQKYIVHIGYIEWYRFGMLLGLEPYEEVRVMFW